MAVQLAVHRLYHLLPAGGGTQIKCVHLSEELGVIHRNFQIVESCAGGRGWPKWGVRGGDSVWGGGEGGEGGPWGLVELSLMGKHEPQSHLHHSVSPVNGVYGSFFLRARGKLIQLPELHFTPPHTPHPTHLLT